MATGAERRGSAAHRNDRAVILHDAAALAGRVDARDVLNEVAAVSDALTALGYEVAVLPVSLDLAAFERALALHAPAVVFNLVDSLAGRGRLIHVVPGVLERLGVAFTGCGAATQLLTSNKIAAKEFLAAFGIAVPAVFGGTRAAGLWIGKSCWEHASLGLDDSSVVAASEVPDLLARRRAEFGGEWFAERFVAGRELNVGLLESPSRVHALPVAQIAFIDYPHGKPQILGYAAKWEPQSLEYRQSRRDFAVPAPLAARVLAIARECWRLVGATGYARVDFRVDDRERCWVLEVNANPCLSPDAGFAAMLERAGITYRTAVEWLVALARQRRPSRRESRV